MRYVVKYFILIMMMFSNNIIQSQQLPEFNGQLSGFLNYSPQNDLDFLIGGRYIPELFYGVPLDTVHKIDFDLSVNLNGSVFAHPFDSAVADVDINLYRFWARYSTNQFELRLGLQKIDFGTATVLRPLQWFNQIDPRDPLQLTQGVYAALARYYFLNNANVWLWALYGNELTRGYDILPTYSGDPEFGGRFQFPLPKGELAFSYNHRNAEWIDSTSTDPQAIPENRFGIDGKWDLGIGLWFEGAQVIKQEDIGILTNQTLFTLGMDYTFGIGSGLNVVGEHMLISSSEETFDFSNNQNVSAITMSYPLAMYDNLSLIFYYSWGVDAASFFINYSHQFQNITGYIMAFYNPEVEQDLQENSFVNNFQGPGVRLMVVFNH